MFMPSERVWNEMRFESSGFWPVPINSGDEFAFLAKVPTHVIKAAYRGCMLSVAVATAVTNHGTVISSVLAIADDPASPLSIMGVHRHPEEQRALEQIIGLGQTIFVFFDELSRPVARAVCRLEEASCISARALLDQTGPRYSGAWIPLLGEVLDELHGQVDPGLAVPPTFLLRISSVPLTLIEFRTSDITALGSHEARQFRLEDRDEGYVLEHGTWHLLENLFGETIFHAPQVTETNTTRELTDIFAHCNVGLCFVETKAMAVLSTAPDRSTERRAKNIEKQIAKALGQLLGAMRSVATGLSVTTRAGAPIVVPTSARPFRHGIVMVSEMIPAIDWPNVTGQLLAASNDTTMFHVLDLQELRLLVGISKGNPILFMANLIYRHEKMRECGNALMRIKLDGPPLP